MLLVMKTILLLNLLGETQQIIAINEPTVIQWFWAIFGVFAYEFAFFTMATDELDGTKKRFPFKQYYNDNRVNWVFAFICVPIIVFYGQQVWYYVMQWRELDWEFMDVLFLLSGLLAGGIFLGLKKLKNIVNAVKNSNNT